MTQSSRTPAGFHLGAHFVYSMEPVRQPLPFAAELFTPPFSL
jgi:hypothetical protein